MRDFAGSYAPPPAKPVDYFTVEEIQAAAGGVLVFDIETYKNYWLCAFKCYRTGKVLTFERSATSDFDPNALLWVLRNFIIVGFNSIKYDMLIVGLALVGFSTEDMKIASDEIIKEGLTEHDFIKKYELNLPTVNHVDLIEVAPLSASLKTYAGRLHCERMQDLPIHPDNVLSSEECNIIKLYCVNDLDNTILLLKDLEPQLELRATLSKEYGTDLRSKSDAQLAEAVIVSELRKLSPKGVKRPEMDVDRVLRYKVPGYITYSLPVLQQMLHTVGKMGFALDGAGRPIMPAELADLSIKIGMCEYRLGMGGLHSSEKSIAHVADDDTFLLDRDVASYYPAIILNQQLYPLHLGDKFLTVYRTIVERRLEAKRTKNKVVADSLKITINGSFGKLGSPYSTLYSPDLMLQVTITGQLSLLMLIEWIESAGIPVVSANTDGIIIKCPKVRYDDLNAIIKAWEEATNFETEETRYKSVWSRDVNNYIAIKTNGECKAKGTYSEKGSALNSVLSKNPQHLICTDALQAFLSKGIQFEETILNCKDIRRFVCIQNVKGGGYKGDEYLGKVIRWYYAKNSTGAINYALSGNKVANSDRAKACMDLPTVFPDDIDYAWYLRKTQEMLSDVGYYNINGIGKLL